MIYRFDRFQADDTAFCLTADGASVPLEPKGLRLLLFLLRNRGRLMRKQELLDAVWSDAAVTENALNRSIGLLRKALDDDSREPRFIQTVPTAGYRFIAAVETTPESANTVQGVPSVTTPAPPSPVGQLQTPSVPSSVRFAALCTGGLLVLAAAGLISRSLHTAPAIRSLAVLPLNNLSGDPSQNYFAEGMTDELITELARIPNLRVVSRTSVMANRDAHLPLPVLARQLDVDAIVEGATVRSGDRIRITAQLIDARTDRHIWAQSFEGPAANVLSLQDSVAQQIAEQARLVLLPASPRPSINPAAHDAYLRALYFFHKQDFPHSITYFQQAISLDPNYASAWAGYSSALDAASTFGFGAPVDLMPKALAAAQRAVQLDPNNGEAYTALGSIQTIYGWDWTAAEQNLIRGIALDSSDPIAEFKYAVFLDAVGRPEDALTHMRRALQLDPLSLFMNRRLGATLYLARDYDAALVQLNRAAEMEDRDISVAYHRSLVYEQKGMHDQAIEDDLVALADHLSPVNIDALHTTYRKHGWRPYWLARNVFLLSAPPQSCTDYQLAIDELRINDPDHAFPAFNRALDQHCFNMALIRVDPLFDPIRNDPRYTALLHRVNLN